MGQTHGLAWHFAWPRLFLKPTQSRNPIHECTIQTGSQPRKAPVGEGIGCPYPSRIDIRPGGAVLPDFLALLVIDGMGSDPGSDALSDPSESGPQTGR